MRKAAERAAAYLVPAQREEPHAGSFSLWRLLGVVTFVGVVVTGLHQTFRPKLSREIHSG